MVTKTYKNFFDLSLLVKDISGYLPGFNKENFVAAFEFAARAHGEQRRKDGVTPYIAHPVAVARILASMHADEDMLIAALLHDVPEDTGFTLGEIETSFGHKVAFLVDGVTKLARAYAKDNFSKSGIESLKKLFMHGVKDPRVILIKLADRLHNMQTLTHLSEERQRRVAQETLDIYIPIANLLGMRNLRRQLEDLCFRFLYPEEFQKLHLRLEDNRVTMLHNIELFIKTVEQALDNAGIEAKVYQRRDSSFRIFQGLRKKNRKIEDFSLIPAVRIEVDNQENCYRALGIVHSIYTPQANTCKDHIANPQVDGRQVLKTSVFGAEGLLTKVIIATGKMIIDAEYGIAAKFFENKCNFTEDKRSRWFDQIADIKEERDEEFIQNLKEDVLADRIVVFTAKGETFDLPKNARIIDFAYAQNDELGNHAIGAYVNGQFKVISEGLVTGDVVKIITDQKVRPCLRWLAFAHTSNAKNKIKGYLRERSRENKLEEGKKLLQKEFDLMGMGHYRDLNFKKLQEELGASYGMDFPAWNDLFLAVGNGDLGVLSVVKAFRRPANVKVNQPKQFVWVKIEAQNRFGLVGDIMKVFYKNSFEVVGIKASISTSSEPCTISVQFLSEEIETVMNLLLELEEMPDVISVRRIFNRSARTFAALMVTTPSLLLLLIAGQKLFFDRVMLGTAYSNADLAVYFSILAVGLIDFYLYKQLKAYHPATRKKPFLLFFFKWLPFSLIVVLFTEMFFYFVRPLALSGSIVALAWGAMGYYIYRRTRIASWKI